MTRFIVVTGTDTGVGKTVVTAALARLFQSRDQTVRVVKPVQTGVAEGEPTDADEVNRRCGEIAEDLARLGQPLAPESAALATGDALPTVAEHVERIRAVDADVVIVEGAGGVLVRLDLDGGTIVDVATALDAEVVVVTRESLGTLNHTGLTVEHLRRAGLDPVLVLGSVDAVPSLDASHNHDDLPRLTGCRVVGRVPAGAGGMEVEDFRHDAPAWFAELD
ncbi:dethiobiotin synthase [Aeromicrobium terrae]|uniref:ATP-dependent dethiobiotin synthetase BioD n=1 Tax=Aeromicrobium terrae TaxID=2498846 RepID=A0A5C8NHS4_9ACTN|nr:dethiobiotin synthase [Aeromicrobium terrae]TXL60636.1 dethiobiotin synthase [Aeromicrobium terrae]